MHSGIIVMVKMTKSLSCYHADSSAAMLAGDAHTIIGR